MSDHDPLCYMYEGKWDGGCQCTLIARVRADELRRPSEDGWMSVRAVLAWEDQVRADERNKIRAEFQPWWENHLKGVRQLIGWDDE